jgi:hypothetical protein
LSTFGKLISPISPKIKGDLGRLGRLRRLREIWETWGEIGDMDINRKTPVIPKKLQGKAPKVYSCTKT